MKNENKKAMLLTLMGIITLVIVIGGATYAFFQAQSGAGKSINATVTTNTTDSLVFETGDILTITANQENFASGAGNRTGSTFAKASLRANSATNSATANYYVYLDLTTNELTYSTPEKTAELILKVTGPDNAEITTLDGLKYVTVADGKGEIIKGFDITGVEQVITIANNHEIVSTGTKDETWNIELILVNLDSDQNANTNKSVVGTLKIQKDLIPYHTICKEGTLACYIARKYTDGSNGLYYHNSTLANGAGDNSYRYAGASPNNYVCFGNDGTTGCPDANLYRIIGVFSSQVKLIKADYAGQTELGKVPDANGNKFASDPYHGKLTTIPLYSWSGSSSNTSNTWSTSTFNTGTLNGTYLTNLGTDWSNKIATATWKVGGNAWANIAHQNASTTYANEIKKPVSTNSTDSKTEDTFKVGMMYVSDYMYGASPEHWTKEGWNSSDATTDYSAARDDNWIYLGGYYEWTISRQSGTTNIAFSVSYSGIVYYDGVQAASGGVRPTFYLNSNVTLIGGTGTSTDPYRIN